MKLPINDIIKFKPLYSKIKEQTLPISTTYKLSKFFNQINPELDFYAQELRKLLEKYADRDVNGNIIREGDNIQLKPDSLPEFTTAFQRLSELEVDAPDIIFSIDELSDLKITVEDFNAFLPFIIE